MWNLFFKIFWVNWRRNDWVRQCFPSYIYVVCRSLRKTCHLYSSSSHSMFKSISFHFLLLVFRFLLPLSFFTTSSLVWQNYENIILHFVVFSLFYFYFKVLIFKSTIIPFFFIYLISIVCEFILCSWYNCLFWDLWDFQTGIEE